MAFLAHFFRESSQQTCLQPDSGVYSIETSVVGLTESASKRQAIDALDRSQLGKQLQLHCRSSIFGTFGKFLLPRGFERKYNLI
jgi:hypothetical protein